MVNIIIISLSILASICIILYAIYKQSNINKIIITATDRLAAHNIKINHIYRLTDKTTGNVLMYRPLKVSIWNILNTDNVKNKSNIPEVLGYLSNPETGKLNKYRNTVDYVIEFMNDSNYEIKDFGRSIYN